MGSISGQVTDPSQAPVPDASVTVANTKTGLSYAAATTADGYYTVRFLPPGTYSVSVTKDRISEVRATQSGGGDRYQPHGELHP